MGGRRNRTGGKPGGYKRAMRDLRGDGGVLHL